MGRNRCKICPGDGREIHTRDRVRVDGDKQVERLTVLSGKQPGSINRVPLDGVPVRKEEF